MKTQILRILRETFMPEAEVDPHTTDRVNDRIAKMSDDDLPKEVKERIFDTLRTIEDTDFPSKKSFVVFLGQFTPNPKSSYFEVFRDKPYYNIEGSIGNQFWAIIRANKIDTFMLAMDFQTSDSEANASRLNVDYSIKNINKFVERLNKTKTRREQIPMVTINGVKWVVDISNETIHKKNKPAVKHKIVDMLDSVDDATQEEIMNFF